MRSGEPPERRLTSARAVMTSLMVLVTVMLLGLWASKSGSTGIRVRFRVRVRWLCSHSLLRDADCGFDPSSPPPSSD